MKHAFWISLVSVVLAGACAENTENNSGPKLVNGQLAQSSDYPATVVYLMPDGGLCTATKVATRFFLTAAHCVATGSGQVSRSLTGAAVIKASNFPKRNVADTSMWHSNRVKRVILNDDFVRTCQAAGVDCSFAISNAFVPAPDLALIEFYNDLPAQWPSARIDKTYVWDADKVAVVGYGCENGLDNPDTPDERKKFGHTYVVPGTEVNKPNVVVDSNKFDLFDSRYFLTPGTHYNYQSSTSNVSVCPGDSGGPVYRTGTDIVVGVIASYTFYDPSDGYSWVNLHARLADPIGLNPNVTLWLQSYLPGSSITSTQRAL